jgi:predicted MPP superfamily phosphohydrolase
MEEGGLHFNRIKKGFNMPCYSAPGNHDIGNKPDAKSLAYYRKTIGNDYYSFENKGVSFVVTNTQLWKEEVGEESKKHDQWFERTLDSIGENKLPSMVVGHYPIFIKTTNEKEAYFNLPMDDRKKILDLFKKNKVQAYLSGHRHETIINTTENVQFVSGETTSKNFDGRPMGFRLWNVSLKSLKHEFVPLLDVALVK